ncbi:hypothetical protein K493DRAFT_257895 [Basidiobolus meristosporus CBS 931.73]|uniref:Zn(2)-C6 fungal-type domain-containing protein n=1 Tax=Basidiobolus meristosporus CBS 931.73 TaxID=1314790 RepID=A0A1Y1YLD0_9FUNG|nr:hypothetical protein K493DRAFT_257895 [Basidiobolus meristosporus CBS 931.73]|eukprot:ORX98802.1 hypothetical protein K493DRAFT_257895 [Basidiobolus meristosporus CBS 931.73]
MCRQRKVKCDGAKPKCRGCFLFDYDCTYIDSRARRTPNKEFNEVLESRLKRIESTVSKLVQTQPAIAQHLLAQLQGLNDPLGEEEHHLFTEEKQVHEEDTILTNDETVDSSLSESDDDELNSNLNSLTLEDRNRCKYFGPSSGLYLLNQGKLYKDSTLFEQTYVRAPGGSSNPDIEFELMCDPSIDFLTPEMLNQLLEIYFDKAHPYLPIFHKGDFLNRVRNNEKPLAILLNAALAVACVHSGNSELYANPAKVGSPGDVFFNRAKNLLDKQYRVSQVTTVQALVLMSMVAGDGWLFLGMAIRMAQDIGLHRHMKKPTRGNMSFIEMENRKRAWWGCFVMDRWISAILGRPISIDENDFDTKVIYTGEEEPISYKSSSSPSSSQEHSSPQPANSDISLRYFVQLTKLSSIFGRVLKTVYAVRSSSSSKVVSVLIDLNKALCAWKTALPSEFNYDPQKTNSPFADVLYTYYYGILILLNRPFLPKMDQVTNLEDHPALNICTRAANMITYIQYKALQENYAGGFLIKMVGMLSTNTIHLINLFSPFPVIARAARINLVVSINILERYSKFAFTANACSVFMKELLSDRNIAFTSDEPLVPVLLENEIPQLNPSKIRAVVPERNDSEVMLLLSENTVQHSTHTPGSADSIGRTPIVFSQGGGTPQPTLPSFPENGFDFATGLQNFDLADSMYNAIPPSNINNLNYAPADQTPLYPNNMQHFMGMPPTDINQSPLFLNSFPMSMDVEEWSTYMDQNMLENPTVTGISPQ